MVRRKADFVTNSSSASFILHVCSNYEDLDDFKREFYKCISREEYDTNWYEPQSVEQDDHDRFRYKIEACTSMYNYMTDVPRFMRMMVTEHAMSDSDLSQYGIRDVRIEVVRDY